MKATLLLLAILLTSCGSIKTTDRLIEDEFETYNQELRYERDVYRTALEECKGN